MEIKFKKLVNRAHDPIRATDHSAGIDLVAITRSKHTEFIEYGTGLAFEIPQGHVGLLFARSSVSKTSLILANSVGVIDSDYRGEVKLRFKKVDNKLSEYGIGERVGQLVIVPVPQYSLTQADELSDTERGEGGFGSTGK